MKFRIIKEYDDNDGLGCVVLGYVKPRTGGDDLVWSDVIKRAWLSFQATKPDTDSAFIAYLVEHHGFVDLDHKYFEDVFL